MLFRSVLRKRENYRKAFANFDVHKVAALDESDIERLLLDPGIVRNRLKVVSAITNARHFIDLQREHGSFSNYIWGFVGNEPIVNHWASVKEIPASTELSDRISKEMNKRGFKFFGTTICYAFLQAMGVVNDHTTDCFRYGQG